MKITITQNITDKTDFYAQADDGHIFHICEGTGDNLLQEDIDNGCIDYIYYEIYESLKDAVEQNEYDGGMVLLEKYYQDMSIQEIMDAVADMEQIKFVGVKK